MLASGLSGLRARTLCRDIALCSWQRHFTRIYNLSTQVYKCTHIFNAVGGGRGGGARGKPAMG